MVMGLLQKRIIPSPPQKSFLQIKKRSVLNGKEYKRAVHRGNTGGQGNMKGCCPCSLRKSKECNVKRKIPFLNLWNWQTFIFEDKVQWGKSWLVGHEVLVLLTGPLHWWCLHSPEGEHH